MRFYWCEEELFLGADVADPRRSGVVKLAAYRMPVNSNANIVDTDKVQLALEPNFYSLILSGTHKCPHRTEALLKTLKWSAN